jgi:hypothetical protein
MTWVAFTKGTISIGQSTSNTATHHAAAIRTIEHGESMEEKDMNQSGMVPLAITLRFVSILNYSPRSNGEESREA